MRRRAAHRRSRAGAALVLLLVLAALSSHSAPSWADGDPASDVLLAQDVFYPYEPKVSPGLEGALESTLRAASRAASLHLKVAIIGAPNELGLVQRLFGHPQAYARFLEREIAFNQPQPLLVVMPVGFGLVAATGASALASVPIHAQQRSNGLTRSAILAVAALARYRGHPIPIPSPSSSSSGGSPPALLVFGLPAALLALGALIAMRRGGSRRAGGAPDGDGHQS
jgi:hypothetical protein